MRRFGITVTTALAAAFATTGPASAATISVDTKGDQFGAGAKCSLREATQAANDDAAFGGCRAGNGADVIRLAGKATYKLTRADTGAIGTGALALLGEAHIKAAGKGRATINGSALADAILEVAGTGNRLSKLRVTGGHNDLNGGAIVVGSSSELTVRRSVVSGNRTDLDGGGFVNLGTLKIVDTTVANNRSNQFGGGVMTASSAGLIVIGSTFSGNRALGLLGSGGAITNYSGSTELRNSTLSGNRATGDGGGLYLPAGFATLRNVTITRNVADSDAMSSGSGGGFANVTGISSAVNTIIAGNTDAGDNSGPDCSGNIALSHSLLGSQSSCSGFIPTPDVIIGEPAGLKPLAANGGETKTHALRKASRARNRGNPAVGGGPAECLARDQRGVRRPQQGRCDIGAYEFKKQKKKKKRNN